MLTLFDKGSALVEVCLPCLIKVQPWWRYAYLV